MSDCVYFGVIADVDPERDYSDFSDFNNDYEKALEFYRCVAVPDDIVNEWILPVRHIPSFTCSLRRLFSGINHYGVTLLPPESIGTFLEIVKPYGGRSPWRSF